ncbi:hypothetical protein [Enterovibrio norvegicus]|uniref:hypothetical protein n=1 Tax=Enterovibrio norvegicus TaxID=188144 RepID=UPI0010BF3123|nr:hypothetical protein [Enterovibrio norvegicus]TKF29322.1 hypothetical protein FCV83_21940 [Enterovibrio norvegicus]
MDGIRVFRVNDSTWDEMVSSILTCLLYDAPFLRLYKQDVIAIYSKNHYDPTFWAKESFDQFVDRLDIEHLLFALSESIDRQTEKLRGWEVENRHALGMSDVEFTENADYIDIKAVLNPGNTADSSNCDLKWHALSLRKEKTHSLEIVKELARSRYYKSCSGITILKGDKNHREWLTSYFNILIDSVDSLFPTAFESGEWAFEEDWAVELKASISKVTSGVSHISSLPKSEKENTDLEELTSELYDLSGWVDEIRAPYYWHINTYMDDFSYYEITHQPSLLECFFEELQVLLELESKRLLAKLGISVD